MMARVLAAGLFEVRNADSPTSLHVSRLARMNHVDVSMLRRMYGQRMLREHEGANHGRELKKGCKRNFAQECVVIHREALGRVLMGGAKGGKLHCLGIDVLRIPMSEKPKSVDRRCYVAGIGGRCDRSAYCRVLISKRFMS